MNRDADLVWAGEMEPVASSKKEGRLFIVDPMCVLPYGHNQGALLSFREQLRGHFTSLHVLVPQVLSQSLAAKLGFERCLTYPYSAIAETRFAAWLEKHVQWTAARRFLKNNLRLAEKALLRGIQRLSKRDPLFLCMERNWGELVKRFGLTEKDCVFFPSADYYGIRAVLDQARKNVQKNPRLHFRFVGVMENAALVQVPAPLDLVIESLRQALAEGVRLTVSAETRTYADILAERLGRDVFYFPAPLIGEWLPMPRSLPVIIASVGQGRKDKGYFSLAAIAEKTKPCVTGGARFAVQIMPRDHAQFNAVYEAHLASLPCLDVLPPLLSPEEVRDLYARSFAIIMPYDASAFRWRGSSVYQDALSYGRPVICTEGSAFAAQVAHYGNGFVVKGFEDCAEALEHCVTIPPEEWEVRLTQARRRYQADIAEAVQLFLEPCS